MLMAATMKTTFFWDVVQYNLAETDRRPDYGDSKHLWNVGQFVPDYTAQYPRRQSSPHIILFIIVTVIVIYLEIVTDSHGRVVSIFPLRIC
jgi:hypothetical protein